MEDIVKEGKRFVCFFCFLWHSYGRSIVLLPFLFSSCSKRIPEVQGQIRPEVTVFFFLTAFS